MKQWVRNRVNEIIQLTKRENWLYIESRNMMADLGMRKGAKLDDISENSSWIIGQDWPKSDKKSFPIKSVNDLQLCNEEKKIYINYQMEVKSKLPIQFKNCNDKYLVTQGANVFPFNCKKGFIISIK